MKIAAWKEALGLVAGMLGTGGIARLLGGVVGAGPGPQGDAQQGRLEKTLEALIQSLFGEGDQAPAEPGAEGGEGEGGGR